MPRECLSTPASALVNRERLVVPVKESVKRDGGGESVLRSWVADGEYGAVGSFAEWRG